MQDSLLYLAYLQRGFSLFPFSCWTIRRINCINLYENY